MMDLKGIKKQMISVRDNHIVNGCTLEEVNNLELHFNNIFFNYCKQCNVEPEKVFEPEIDEKVLNLLNSIQNDINELKKKRLELIKKVKMNLKKKEKV